MCSLACSHFLGNSHVSGSNFYYILNYKGKFDVNRIREAKRMFDFDDRAIAPMFEFDGNLNFNIFHYLNTLDLYYSFPNLL